MRPEANSGALLQLMPPAGTLPGTRFGPLITIHAFCASSGPPPATVTDVIVPGTGLLVSENIAAAVTPAAETLSSNAPGAPLAVKTGAVAMPTLFVMAFAETAPPAKVPPAPVA